jgi:hypothetical protein
MSVFTRYYGMINMLMTESVVRDQAGGFYGIHAQPFRYLIDGLSGLLRQQNLLPGRRMLLEELDARLRRLQI